MVVFSALGALIFVVLGLLLWRLAREVSTEAQRTVSAVEAVSRALGSVNREVARADLHLDRLKQLRVRRIFTARLLSRLLARRRT